MMSCKSDKNKIVSNNKEVSSIPAVVNDSNEEDSKHQAIDTLQSVIDKKVEVTTVTDPIIEDQKTIQPKPSKVVITKNITKNTPSKKSQIQFEELTWDFGEITEGDIIEKKFKFTNTGDAPLEIIATSATCGCTRPSFPFLDIAPGESNVIGVNFNSVGKDGEQNPEVTIESNTKPKITVIKLHGIVNPKPKKEETAETESTAKDTIASKQ